jgi:hypothetical protein
LFQDEFFFFSFGRNYVRNSRIDIYQPKAFVLAATKKILKSGHLVAEAEAHQLLVLAAVPVNGLGA